MNTNAHWINHRQQIDMFCLCAFQLWTFHWFLFYSCLKATFMIEANGSISLWQKKQHIFQKDSYFLSWTQINVFSTLTCRIWKSSFEKRSDFMRKQHLTSCYAMRTRLSGIGPNALLQRSQVTDKIWSTCLPITSSYSTKIEILEQQII